MRSVLSLALAVPFAGVALAAAPPATVPGPGSEFSPQSPASKPPQEYQGLGLSRQLTQFAGVVMDVGDHALNGVQVKLSVDGQIVGSAVTEAGGYYEIRVPYDDHSDTTVLLWYVPVDKNLMPKEIVIRESKASQENGLISKCVPRATLTPGRQFRVYLFDAENRNKDLAETNCLP